MLIDAKFSGFYPVGYNFHQIPCYWTKRYSNTRYLIRCHHNFSRKRIKLINFQFSKEYKLKLNRKLICIKVFIFFVLFNLNEIFLEDCKWILND